jgi:gamma-glutamyltranspeptidase/glutathione hydrolase
MLKKYYIPLFLIFFILSFLTCSDNSNNSQNNTNTYEPPEFHDSRAISGFGTNAMVAGTSGKPAIEAALEVLKDGGNACDAVLAGAMDQIALAAGCWVSYGGHMHMVYYKADTGEVFTISGAFKSLYEETDPITIPEYEPSGRTALVPGFLGAVDEAHKKLGRLTFERILEPAIKTAEDGFRVSAKISNLFQHKWDVITRLPEGKAIFAKPDGSSYKAGEIFKQPLLAETLRKFAAQRSDYIYKGEWARNFVQIVQREGGKITMKDMEDYKPIWTKPAHTNYYGYDIYAVNYPCTGGLCVINGLNIMQAAGLENIEGYTTNPSSFFNFVKIARIGYLYANFLDFQNFMERHYPEIKFTNDFMLDPGAGQFFWELIRSGTWSNLEKEYFGSSSGPSYISDHSDAIVAIDAMGNAASLSHSISTTNWGNTGIFVDGISIPDSGSLRRYEIYVKGPGQYLFESMSSVVVVKDGRAFLAGGSPGSSIRELTLQNLFNIINDGMDPARSIARRAFYCNDFYNPICTRIPASDFSTSFIDEVKKLGQCITLVSDSEHYWVGILFDPTRGFFGGAPTEAPYNPGIAAY